MKVLVAYATHLGSTHGIAERIAETLKAEGIGVRLESVDHLGLITDEFDAFVIGSAVHAGHWLKPATEFLDLNRDVLARKPVWLFSSGPIGEKAVRMPQPDPKELNHFRDYLTPRDHVVFAGAFDRTVADERGGLLERAVNRFIPEGDYRDWPKIEAWARSIAGQLEPVLV